MTRVCGLGFGLFGCSFSDNVPSKISLAPREAAVGSRTLRYDIVDLVAKWDLSESREMSELADVRLVVKES